MKTFHVLTLFPEMLEAVLGNSIIGRAEKAGFDAVDLTCYYIPGYSNTTMPTLPEKDIVKYAREIKKLSKKLGIEVSGTGIQNNFADPNRNRRETDVERIKFWIKIAAEMGAPVIRIFAVPVTDASSKSI